MQIMKIMQIMKSLLIPSFLFFVFLNCTFFQGNLQFNRVLIATVPSTGSIIVNNSNPLATTSITVPVGKVWKIESASILEGGVGPKRIPSTFGISMDFDSFLLAGPDNLNNQTGNFPVWVPSGTYNLNLNSCCSAACNCQGKISVIEFNVIP
jgi:hypothetical protein